MNAATAMQMSHSSAMRKPHHPMSLRVAFLAQKLDIKEDPVQTDVMVYRQPASDVPVPASWRPSKPVPLEPMDTNCDDDDGYDEDMVGWESAGVSVDRLERFERHTEPRRIGAKRSRAGARLSILLVGSVVTFTLIGWVTFI